MPLVHDKEAILQDCIRVIQDEGLTTLTELETFLPIALKTLYNPEWEEVYQSVKEELLKQRVRDKVKYKQAWKKPNAAPVLQLAGFKLIADADELERLTVNNNNNRQSGELQVTWQENRSFTGELIPSAEVIQVEPAPEQQVIEQHITQHEAKQVG
jgi:hypothetical protein